MEPESDKEATLDDQVTFPQIVQKDISECSTANPSASAEVDQHPRKEFETEMEKTSDLYKKTDNTDIDSRLTIPRQAPLPTDSVVEPGDVPTSGDLVVSKDASNILHMGGDLTDNGPAKPITESEKKDIPFLTEPSSEFPDGVSQVETYTTTISDQETDDRPTKTARHPINLTSVDANTDVQDTQTSDTSPGYNRAAKSQDLVSLTCHSIDKIANCSPKQRKPAAKILKLQRHQGLGKEPDLSIGGNHFYMDNSSVHLGDGHGDTQKQTNSVLENIIDDTKLMMDNKDPAKHVSTYAERSAQRLLKTFSAVFIKGRSGSGKTSVGLKLLKELTKEDKRTPVYLTHAHQWSLIPKKQEFSRKYVVMIDDIFGSSNLVQSQLEEWSRLFDVMWPSVESGQILLVITSRPEVSAQCENKVKKYKLMKTIQSRSVTLDEGEFALRAAEKEKLLKKICGKRLDLTTEEINNIVRANTSISLGFPQCCEFFASNPYVQKHGTKFFHESVEYVGETISRLKETDQLGYAVLLLVMLNQGILVHDQLKSTKSLCDFEYLVSELSKALGLTKCLSRIQIKTKAESFLDIYLKKQCKNYYFKHQSLLDALFNAMAKEHPETLIKICPVQMLLERVKIHDGTEGQHGFLSLTPDCYDQLAKRITEILFCKQDRRILEHPSLQDKRFLVTVRWKEFTPEAKIRPERIVLASLMIPGPDGRHSRTDYSLFHCDNLFANIVLNCRISGGSLLRKIFKRSKNADDSSQVLACAIYTGQSDLVKMLLDKGVSADQRCFRALCGSRDLNEVVTDRVLKQMDWNVFLDRKMLYLALTRGNSLLTKKLLSQICTERETTVLECLKVMYSDIQLREDLLSLKLQTTVSMLLDCIQNPDIDTKSPGYCSLIVMCAWHAYSLKEIFSRQWNFTSDQWWHSLNEALKQGSIECVEELIAHHRTDPCRTDDLTEYICNAVVSRQNIIEKIILILNHFSTIALTHSEYSDTDASTWIKAQLNSSDCNLPIHSAVNHQNIEVMKHFTDAGADVNLLDKKGRSPLHIAAKQNAIQAVQFLIQHGANVNVQDKKGETSLHHAVKNHFMDCVNLLLEAGADVSIKNCDMLPVFLLAEKLGIIKRLLSSGSDINITDKEGRTALHKAIQRCDMDTVKFLLTKGANVDCADSDGHTPLHIAAVFADVDILKYICEKGATMTETTHKRGKAVVHCAAQSQVDALEKMQYLFHIQNIPADEVDGLGRTALFYLIDSWDQEVAEFLIEKGCDLHHQNDTSKTLLFEAANKKNKPAFDFLMKKGLDVRHVDKHGHTLLHTVCFGMPDTEHFKWVSSLLDAGVDPDKCSCYNRTALHMVVRSYSSDKSLQVCQLLIERMTNVDQQDTGQRGQTALHFAVRYGFKKIVHLLLQKGADRSIKDDNGKTAEDYAYTKAMRKLFESHN